MGDNSDVPVRPRDGWRVNRRKGMETVPTERPAVNQITAASLAHNAPNWRQLHERHDPDSSGTGSPRQSLILQTGCAD